MVLSINVMATVKFWSGLWLLPGNNSFVLHTYISGSRFTLCPTKPKRLHHLLQLSLPFSIILMSQIFDDSKPLAIATKPHYANGQTDTGTDGRIAFIFQQRLCVTLVWANSLTKYRCFRWTKRLAYAYSRNPQF